MRRNVAMLAGAYVMGQGCMFASQTWLVAEGRLAFVGMFGLAYTFATLVHLFLDWGGLTLLARQELSGASRAESNLFFSSLSAVRLVVAAVAVCATLAWAGIGESGFTHAYVLAAAPSFLLVAVNPAGIIDGMKQSGINGVAAALPVLASATGLLIATDSAPAVQGAILGAAFTVGYLASVTLQYAALARLGRQLHMVRPSGRSVRAAAREGWLLTLTLLPTHSFYRLQVMIAAWLFGPAATGLFIYAKQIGNAALQAAYFIRRAEFPKLMNGLRENPSVSGIFILQRNAINVGILAALGLFVAGMIAWFTLENEIGAAGLLGASLAPVVLASALYATFYQAYVGAKKSKTATLATNVGAAVGLALSVPLAVLAGLYGLVIAEIMMNIIGLVLLMKGWTISFTHGAPCARKD